VSLISPLSEVSLLQNIWANERLRYRADREQNRIQPDRVTLAPRFGRRGQSCFDLRLLAMAQLDPRGTFAPTQRQCAVIPLANIPSGMANSCSPRPEQTVLLWRSRSPTSRFLSTCSLSDGRPFSASGRYRPGNLRQWPSARA
jgi:hypothetical protein